MLAEMTGEPVESVRVFLDSRMGEQFAHAVIDRFQTRIGLGRGVRIVAGAWMARPLNDIARLVYRMEAQSFLVGWIKIMQMP